MSNSPVPAPVALALPTALGLGVGAHAFFVERIASLRLGPGWLPELHMLTPWALGLGVALGALLRSPRGTPVALCAALVVSPAALWTAAQTGATPELLDIARLWTEPAAWRASWPALASTATVATLPFLLAGVALGGAISRVAWPRRALAAVIAGAALGMCLSAVLLPMLGAERWVAVRERVTFSATRSIGVQTPWVASRWSARGLQHLSEVPRLDRQLAGRGTRARAVNLPEQWLLGQDTLGAGLLLGEFGSPHARSLLERTLHGLACRLSAEPRVLLLGLGDGTDARAALRGGARALFVTEPDPWTRQRVRERAVELRTDPRLHLLSITARSGLARGADRFDVIQIGDTRSWSETQTDAVADRFAYLRTTEALRASLSRLNDQGLLQILQLGDPQSLRPLLGSLRAALEPDEGTMDASVAILHAPPHVLVLVGKQPLSEARTAAIETYARQQGVRLWHAPGRDGEPGWRTAQQASAAAPGDDRPVRASAVGLALRCSVAGTAALFALCVIGLCARLLRPHQNQVPSGLWARAALGLGLGMGMTALSEQLPLFVGHGAYAALLLPTATLLGMGGGALLERRAGLSSAAVCGALTAGWGLLLCAARIDVLLALPDWIRLATATLLLADAGLSAGVLLVREPSQLHAAHTTLRLSTLGVAIGVGSLLGVSAAQSLGHAGSLAVGLACCALGAVASAPRSQSALP